MRSKFLDIAGGMLLCATIAFVAVFLDRGCGGREKFDVATDSLLQEIKDLKEKVAGRDTLLMESSDTVIYRVREVRSTIVDYRTETDTVLKLMKCDSLADRAEKLARDCERNDSLHWAQENDLKDIVAKQDTVISDQGSELKDERRRSRRWKWVSAGAGVLVLGLVLLK